MFNGNCVFSALKEMLYGKALLPALPPPPPHAVSNADIAKAVIPI